MEPTPLCQSGRLFGADCARKAEGLVVPAGQDPVAVYKDRMILCPPCARHVLKADITAKWLPLTSVRALVAEQARASFVPDTITPAKEAPMSAVAEATTIVIDIPPTAPSPPAPVPVFNGIPHLVPVPPPAPRADVQEATPHIVAPPPPLTKEQEAAALRAAAEQLKASFAAQKAALQAQLDALAAEEKAAKEADIRAKEAEYLARRDSWNHDKLRGLLVRGGHEALRGLEQAISDGFLTMRKAKAPATDKPAKQTGTPVPTRASTPDREALKAEVRQLHAQGMKQADIAKQTGLDSRQVWNILNPKRAA